MYIFAEIDNKHKKFIAALATLLNEHELDLVLMSGDEKGRAKLCVVSDGEFSQVASIDTLSTNYEYVRPYKTL